MTCRSPRTLCAGPQNEEGQLAERQALKGAFRGVQWVFWGFLVLLICLIGFLGFFNHIGDLLMFV